jgi:hypothetical protein
MTGQHFTRGNSESAGHYRDVGRPWLKMFQRSTLGNRAGRRPDAAAVDQAVISYCGARRRSDSPPRRIRSCVPLIAGSRFASSFALLEAFVDCWAT